jgi:Protein of unknown function (DUF3618)
MPPEARARTPEEIRASIEQNRYELGNSLEKLRAEVVAFTDWRAKIRPYQSQIMVGAAVTGFVLGGGIAAITSLTFGRRRRRRALKAGAGAD